MAKTRSEDHVDRLLTKVGELYREFPKIDAELDRLIQRVHELGRELEAVKAEGFYRKRRD